MNKFASAEISIFCIVLISFELISILLNITRDFKRKLLANFLLVMILSILTDFAWDMLEGVSHPVFLSHIILQSHFFFAISASFLWFMYSEHLQSSPILKNKIYFILAIIPAILVEILTICGLIYKIGPTGEFVKGSLYYFEPIIACGYFILTAIVAFVKALRKKNYAQRIKLLALSSWAIFPTIFALIQIIFNTTIPTSCIGITISIILICQTERSALITKDYLTELSNRNQLVQFLNKKMKSNDNDKTYLIIMDIDDFKIINDVYGHISGDEALIFVAEVLKEIVPKDCIISRFGGDEFIISGNFKSENDVTELIALINSKLIEYRQTINKWNLQLSFGHAKISEEIKSISDLIDKADLMLYKNKRIKKTENKQQKGYK